MSPIKLHRYYKEMIDAVSDGLMVVGKDGTILMVNSYMEDLTGFSPQELMGASCTILNCDACELIRSESRKKWCKLFEIERVKGKRCMMMKKNGAYVSAVKNASLLRDESGEVFGALETFIDISAMDLKDLQIRQLSQLLDEGTGFFGMVGRSPAMDRVYQILEKAAQSDAPVIIFGESGTGKELAAHAIHQLGRRREGPFVRFNCAALNDSLIESELFGHAKGAFTGAYRHRKGRFEAAHTGDIFLDEIGDIPLSTQTRLLRVVDTKQFERVGDHRPISADVRIITATNRNLTDLIAQGKFREDLFFRINVVPIHLPPLRERRDDIPLLVKFFIGQLHQKSEKKITGLHPRVLALFMAYPWPGNIRELKSALEYAFVIAESGLIELSHLPAQLQDAAREFRFRPVSHRKPGATPNTDEKEALLAALRAAGGNKSTAAKILGVNRMTVWNRMRRYGLEVEKTVQDHN
jgi:two-component system, NtrC family, response regulator HydG